MGVKWFRRDDMEIEPQPEPERRIELLRELVDQLPPDQQLVLSLRFFGSEPRTLKQIAEETGMKVYKVKGLLEHGLDSLRTVLEGYGLGSVLADYDTPDRDVLGPLAVGAAGIDA